MFPSSSKIKSLIEYLILLAVGKENSVRRPDLIKILREEFAGEWMPKAGTIHPILERLEVGGVVQQADEGKKGAKHPYIITQKGKKTLINDFQYFEKVTEFNDHILKYGATQFEPTQIIEYIEHRTEEYHQILKDLDIKNTDNVVKERLQVLSDLFLSGVEMIQEKIKRIEEGETFVQIDIR